jgi:hypothetical protein
LLCARQECESGKEQELSKSTNNTKPERQKQTRLPPGLFF